jgi:hypothetical protein
MESTGNLPGWPGANAIYKRLGDMATAIAANSYETQRAAWKGPAKRFKFAPPEDVVAIREALNKGDEADCKGLWHALRARHGWPG